jgi:hypothetical protein
VNYQIDLLVPTTKTTKSNALFMPFAAGAVTASTVGFAVQYARRDVMEYTVFEYCSSLDLKDKNYDVHDSCQQIFIKLLLYTYGKSSSSVMGDNKKWEGTWTALNQNAKYASDAADAANDGGVGGDFEVSDDEGSQYKDG